MERRKRDPLGAILRALPKVLTGLTVLLALGFFLLFIVLPGLRDGDGPSPILNDTNRLRQLAGLAITAPEFPLKDAVFDPYAFVRDGLIEHPDYDLFRSERQSMGPTDEEIERGDYTRFPWERRRGNLDRDPKAPAVLLLWEKVPDKHGGRVVAFSDGSAKYLEAEEFEAQLRAER